MAALRSSGVARSMISTPSRWSASCCSMRATSSEPSMRTRFPLMSRPSHTTLSDRSTGTVMPGRDRQPSSSTSVSSERSTTTGLHDTPSWSSRSKMMTRFRTPICGAASPMPGASYMAAAITFTRRGRSASAMGSTGAAICFSAGFGWARISIWTSRISWSRSGQRSQAMSKPDAARPFYTPEGTLHQVERIHVRRDGHALARADVAYRAQHEPGKPVVAGRRLQQDVPPVQLLDPRQHARAGPQHLTASTCVPRQSLRQRRGWLANLLQVLARYVDVGKAAEGRVSQLLTVMRLWTVEHIRVTSRRGADGGMVRPVGLDHDRAGARPAPSAARDLCQQLERPLSGAEVRQVKRRVGVDDADQGHLRIVESLRHHLGSEQHAALQG